MKKIITSADPQGYLLLNYNGPNAGYDRRILDQLSSRISEALMQHSQVLTVPLVIRFPKDLQTTGDNNCFQYFMEEYRRKLNSHEFSPHYVWVTERKTSQNRHYHLILFLNGNKIRFFSIPPREANLLWEKALHNFYGYTGAVNGLIHVHDGRVNGIGVNHGYLLKRGDQEMLDLVLENYSYFAKVNTKGVTPFRVREFGSSQIGR